MQALRKAVFYVLLLVYLAVCPCVILYSFGFILDPHDKHVVQTGLVQIKTIPKGATVCLNDTPYPEKTPLIIRGLLPGNYTTRVLLDGHVAWEREISVSTGKPVVYENVLLFPQTWKPKEISSRRFSTMIPVPGTSIIILGQGDSLNDFTLFYWKDNDMRPLVPVAEETRESKVLKVFTVEGSDVAVVERSVRGRKGYMWIKIGEERSQVQDISHLFVEEPRRIVWDPEAPYRLFSWQAGHLNRVDVDQDCTQLKVLEAVKGFGMHDKEIYFLDQDGRFLRTDAKATHEEVLLADQDLRTLLFENRTDVQIIWLDRETVIFLDSNGSLIANHLPYYFVNQGVVGWEFDRKHRQLLLWTKKRIGILDFSEVSMEDEGVFERGPRVNWIYDKGRDVRRCYWVNKGSYILFRDKGDVYLLELDPYSGAVLYPVTRINEESEMTYIEETGNMYFIGGPDGKLMAQNLIPVGNRFPLIKSPHRSPSGRE